MEKKKMRIKIKSYDSKLVDSSAKKIVSVVEQSGAKAIGPIPLPTKIEKYTILRSVHKFKKTQEAFEIRTHKRVIDITNYSPATVDQLNRITLPTGVDIKITA